MGNKDLIRTINHLSWRNIRLSNALAEIEKIVKKPENVLTSIEKCAMVLRIVNKEKYNEYKSPPKV